MKTLFCISQVLTTLFCCTCFATVYTPPGFIQIPEFMDESDLIIVGSAEIRGYVRSRPPDRQLSAYLHTIQVKKVLYANPEVQDAIFGADDLKRINAALEQETPKQIYVVSQYWLSYQIHALPRYRPDGDYLFLFKDAKLLEKYPNFRVSEYESLKPIFTPVTSLNQQFFFEETVPSVASTRPLNSTHDNDEWLFVIEVLGEFWHTSNLEQKEQRVRQLTRHKNQSIVKAAKRILLWLERERQKQLAREVNEWYERNKKRGQQDDN